MKGLRTLLLGQAPLVLLGAVLLLFGALSPRFLSLHNFLNILVQSSALGIAAVGMTFVLLTAGIDLSVGSIMFLATVVSGKLVLGGAPVGVALAAVVAVALLYGAINAVAVVRLGLLPFVVTLGTLYIGRGLGLMITQTRAMNLPESIVAIGAATFLEIPLPVWAFATVVVLAHLTLSRTPLGRQIYAVGADRDTARRAGLPVTRLLFVAYLVCALCAGLSGFLSVAQVGAVSPSFGRDRELAAIAAAVLGGTSLFGGRGNVFPGTVLGTVLMQTVETGLVIANADPYLYPLVTAGVIFLAVAVDGVRSGQLANLALRKIRAPR